MNSQKQAKRNDAPYQIRRWRIARPESLNLDRDRQRPLKSVLSPNQLSLQESESSIWTFSAPTPDCQPPNLPSPHADFLLSLVQFNTYRAFLDNKMTLSQSVQSIVPGQGIMEYDTAFPGVFHIVPTAQTPTSLALTKLQMENLHAPWIDLIPFRHMRDILIQEQCSYDHIALIMDLVGDAPHLEYLSSNDLFPALRDAPKNSSPDSGIEQEDGDERTTSRSGFIIWGDPSDENNWEITPGFLRKWAWIMQGSEYLISSTNRWRALRGEEPIYS